MKRIRQRIETLENKKKPAKMQPYAWVVKKGETEEDALARLYAEYPNPRPVVLLPADLTREEWVQKYGN